MQQIISIAGNLEEYKKSDLIKIFNNSIHLYKRPQVDIQEILRVFLIASAIGGVGGGVLGVILTLTHQNI